MTVKDKTILWIKLFCDCDNLGMAGQSTVESHGWAGETLGRPTFLQATPQEHNEPPRMLQMFR